MKTFALTALFGATITLAATSAAAADIVHQTSVEHGASTVSVTYEPRTRVKTRQGGLGPRGFTVCLWESTVSIERKTADASGRPIPALTRTVEETRTTTGTQPGYCNHMSARRTAPFGGNSEKLRAFLAGIAANDAPRLRAELASVGALGHSLAR